MVSPSTNISSSVISANPLHPLRKGVLEFVFFIGFFQDFCCLLCFDILQLLGIASLAFWSSCLAIIAASALACFAAWAAAALSAFSESSFFSVAFVCCCRVSMSVRSTSGLRRVVSSSCVGSS